MLACPALHTPHVPEVHEIPRLAIRTFAKTEKGLEVRVARCHICPKKAGHYQFDGTACPWGGILLGALTDILGVSFSCSTRLTPGETCTLQLKRK